MDRLNTYSWPGNIRELENVIKRAVILLKPGKSEIRASDFDYLFHQGQGPPHSLTGSIECLSREMIRQRLDMKTVEKYLLRGIIDQFDGNIMEAVRNTSISKDKFYRNR